MVHTETARRVMSRNHETKDLLPSKCRNITELVALFTRAAITDGMAAKRPRLRTPVSADCVWLFKRSDTNVAGVADPSRRGSMLETDWTGLCALCY